MPRRKQSYDPDYDDVPSQTPPSGDGGPLPGYFDASLIHEFIEQYRPGNYQHCDIVLTEPMLRDIFNAQRDQDMTFTDPWLQYKDSLLQQGYRLHPNATLGTSVMYLLENELDELEEL